MIELRNFADSDIEQLKKQKEYADMACGELFSLIKTWNTKVYKENYFEMYAIVNCGEIVGQASLYGRSEHIVSCGLEIFPGYRKKGYATCAYSELLSRAVQKGFNIAVAQVHVDNSASIALNRKMGFEAENYTYINQKGNPIYYFIKSL